MEDRHLYSASIWDEQKPNHGMRSAMLCSACWEEENRDWVRFKKALREDMRERHAYLEWMNQVYRSGVQSAVTRPGHKFASTLKW